MDIIYDPEEMYNYFKSNYHLDKKLSSENVWIFNIDGEVSQYSLKSILTEHKLHIYLFPYGIAPKDKFCGYRLFQYLLKTNHEINSCFYSIDNNEIPCLNLHLVLKGLSEKMISANINQMIYIADTHYFNILNLASEKKAEVIEEED
jgi:hypothetical protein